MYDDYRRPLIPLRGSSHPGQRKAHKPSSFLRTSVEGEEREAFPLFRLPTELIARVLVFLPSSQVAELRTLCKVLGKTGKVAMIAKLLEAGVEGGQDFETLTTNARNFIDQNQRVWGVLADQFCLAWNRYDGQHVRNEQNCGEVSFFPLNFKSNTAKKIYDLLNCPNLANKFALRRRTVDGQLLVIGVKLNKVPLRARVPVKQYLEELERQRDSFSANLFAQDSYRALLKFLGKRIVEMRRMESRGIQFAFVSYLPKVRSSLKTTTYDAFAAETMSRLSIHTLIASGVGRGDDCVVGTNLDGLQLAFFVPKDEINDVYDRGVKNVIQNTTHNIRRLETL